MNPYLLIGLAMTQKLLAEAASAVGESDWDARPDPERFSFREVIAHMADWEPIMLDRMKTCVDTPGGVIQAYDEVQFAKDHNYAASNPVEQMALFSVARKASLAYITALTEEELNRVANHSERGPCRTKDIAAMMVCHDLYHVEQLRSMKAAGKTVDTW